MATFRGYARAELLRSIENIEMALTHFTHILPQYTEGKPEIADQMMAICNALVMVAETIQKLHDSI